MILFMSHIVKVMIIFILYRNVQLWYLKQLLSISRNLHFGLRKLFLFSFVKIIDLSNFNVLPSNSEIYSETCQTGAIELFEEIVNVWKLWTIFAKSSNLDVMNITLKIRFFIQNNFSFCYNRKNLDKKSEFYLK